MFQKIKNIKIIFIFGFLLNITFLNQSMLLVPFVAYFQSKIINSNNILKENTYKLPELKYISESYEWKNCITNFNKYLYPFFKKMINKNEIKNILFKNGIEYNLNYSYNKEAIESEIPKEIAINLNNFLNGKKYKETLLSFLNIIKIRINIGALKTSNTINYNEYLILYFGINYLFNEEYAITKGQYTYRILKFI